MLVFHDEAEDASPGTASEAVVVLPGGVHMEGRRFLAMEWAKCAEARSRSLERKIRADQINDVIGIADALDCFLGDESHGLKIPCGGFGREGDFRRYEAPSFDFCLSRSTAASAGG